MDRAIHQYLKAPRRATTRLSPKSALIHAEIPCFIEPGVAPKALNPSRSVEVRVDRPIDGVIKADDEASLRIELDEYVITNEIGRRLETFLEAYNNYDTANGVWISGFFGSGKSHLLKMLALLMENREVDGVRAFDIFAEKLTDDPMLAGALRKAISVPSKSMEFVEMIIRRKAPEDQVIVHLVTGPDDVNVERQRELLVSISDACVGYGVEFSWAFDRSGNAHARDIVTDTGWKVVLDRGLDIFQAPIRKDGFSLGDRSQEHRLTKNFYITYLKEN